MKRPNTNSFNSGSVNSSHTSNPPCQETNGSTTSLNSSGSWADRVRRKSSINNQSSSHTSTTPIVPTSQASSNPGPPQSSTKDSGSNQQQPDDPPASVSVEVLNDGTFPSSYFSFLDHSLPLNSQLANKILNIQFATFQDKLLNPVPCIHRLHYYYETDYL